MARRPPPPDVAPALEQAAAAIAKGAWQSAAGSLVEAWSQCRSGRIARALAAVDTRLPAPPPLDGDTMKARELHWHELVKLGDEETLRRIFAAPWPQHPQQAIQRVTLLAKLVSPRISNALLALHRRNQYTSVAGRKLSRTIFNHLVNQSDHAVTEELERLEQNPTEPRRLGPAVFNRRRPATPYLSPAAATALARIEELLSTTGGAEAPARERLLAEVYDAPFEDGPRAVYADALTEAGDPRGELIVLQLQRHRGEATRATLRREKQLLGTGTTHFDGLDLDGASDITLERGFPVAAKMASGAFTSPAWATVESIGLDSSHVFRGSPHLRALRRLYNLAHRDLVGAELPSFDLDLLSVANYDRGLAVQTPFAPRTLALAEPRDFDTMLNVIGQLRRAPIARRVEVIRLAHGIRRLPEITRFLASTESPTIELGGWTRLEQATEWTAQVTRTSLRLRWWGAGAFSEIAFENLYRIARELRKPAFEVLEVTGIDHPLIEKVRTELRAAIASWPALRDVTLWDMRPA